MKLPIKILRQFSKDKILFLLVVSFVLSFQAFAQPKLGIKISPSFVLNRIKIDSENARVTKDGVGFRPSMGIIADFPITDMYSFNTGLTYMPKSIKISVDPLDPDEPAYSNKYSVQYIQVPVTLKLFTNEVSIDKKLYFQAGFNAEFQIYNENKTGNGSAIRTFNFFDIPLVFGAGIEMKLGVSTVLFTGLTYQRGLINVSLKENFAHEEFRLKNDLLGIDVGLKF